MQTATELRIKHANESVTTYRDVHYLLHRDAITVIDAEGDKHVHTDIVENEAYHHRAAA